MKYHSLFEIIFWLKSYQAGTSPSICFINQFTRFYMIQVPTRSYLRIYFIMEIIKTSRRHPNFQKPSICDHPWVQNKFSIKDDNKIEKLPQTKAWRSIRKYLPALKPHHVETGPLAHKASQCTSFHMVWVLTKGLDMHQYCH